jgi:hypothetical protein
MRCNIIFFPTSEFWETLTTTNGPEKLLESLRDNTRVLDANTPESWRETLIGAVENNPSLNKEIETML